MAADAVATVEQRHTHLGMTGKRVGERHPHGTGSHHQVVSINGACHEATMAPERRHVHER